MLRWRRLPPSARPTARRRRPNPACPDRSPAGGRGRASRLDRQRRVSGGARPQDDGEGHDGPYRRAELDRRVAVVLREGRCRRRSRSSPVGGPTLCSDATVLHTILDGLKEAGVDGARRDRLQPLPRGDARGGDRQVGSARACGWSSAPRRTTTRSSTWTATIPTITWRWR